LVGDQESGGLHGRVVGNDDVATGGRHPGDLVRRHDLAVAGAIGAEDGDRRRRTNMDSRRRWIEYQPQRDKEHVPIGRALDDQTVVLGSALFVGEGA
jgi:hypothetical protein